MLVGICYFGAVVRDASARRTFKVLHLWVSQTASSHGWNIPRVTQFRRITVMVKRSNQLQERERERKKSCGLKNVYGIMSVRYPMKMYAIIFFAETYQETCLHSNTAALTSTPFSDGLLQVTYIVYV